jgi:hypothetical protein
MYGQTVIIAANYKEKAVRMIQLQKNRMAFSYNKIIVSYFG